jgi:serine/threonine protein kinase/tetratricopeptide (TPR) repeat protein
MVGEALGRYRVIEKIGSGGMGEVYRAHDDQLDRDVALKVLPVGTIGDEAARRLFRKEALMLAKLNHPSIATIHEFGSQDGVDFLVMELIPGRSLKEILKDGPVPETQIQRLGLELAKGLAAAHEQGVIHRDLKPANMMIISDGRLKILDFGLAKLVEGTAPDLVLSSTQGEGMPGTLPYMSPEQLRGAPVDVRTDVYATGAVLYEMATGQRPFTETNAARLIESILHQAPRPPCQLNGNLSSGLQAILLKSLEKDPEKRYRSVQELRVELERLTPTTIKTTTSITLELSQPSPLEIAHVLFIDLVQYSVLPMEEQRLRLRELHRIARGTKEYVRSNSADQLISLPSGDGMALVFFEAPEAPIRCAVEMSRIISARPEIKLRMGIHSGPVYRVPDINAARAVAGGGINLAQRVMDAGDAGHILVSQPVVDVLGQLSHWSSAFHDLGEVDIKHGGHVHLFNFCQDGVGNPKTPSKLKKTTRKQGVADAKRGSAQRPASGSSRREKRTIQSPVGAPAVQNAAHTDTVQTNVLKVPRWARLSLAACVLVLFAVALLVPTVRDSIFPTLSRRVSTPAGIPSLEEGKHVIVLPFDVQGDRETLGYVAEGLNEELSRKLSSFPTLHVVSASAVTEQAKHQKIDLKGPAESIGRNFGVNLIVRGTVQEGGGWARINVDFDDVADSRRLFTKAFSFAAATINLLDIEDQVFRSIVRELELRPSSEEQIRAASPTGDNEAFDYYLRGGYELSRHTDAEGIRSAIRFYERAIQQDPRFVLAHVGLSNACRAMYRATNEPSWVQKALESAQRAQKLNSDLPEVRLALGDAYQQLGETKDAVAEFDSAKKLSPNSALPWLRLGKTYEDGGHRDQAIDAYTKAVLLAPYSLANRNELGCAFFNFAEYGKALAQFRSVTDLDPGNYYGYMNTGAVHLAQGKYEESIQEFKKALEVAPDGAHDDANIHSDLGTAYFYLKRYSDSVNENERAVKIGPTSYLLVGNLADAYRWSEKKKKAEENYEIAIDLASKQLEMNPRNVDALGNLALYYAKNGDLRRATDCIRRARWIDPSNLYLIFDEATVRVIAKQTPQALESLKLALEKGYSPKLVEVDPEFASLRGNSNFEKLMKEYSGKSN